MALQSTVVRLIVALTIGTAMACLGWVSMNPSLPLNGFFGNNPAIGIPYFFINLPGFYFGILVSGNAHGGSEGWNTVGIFIEWTLLGYLFAWLFRKKIPSTPSVDV